LYILYLITVHMSDSWCHSSERTYTADFREHVVEGNIWNKEEEMRRDLRKLDSADRHN